MSELNNNIKKLKVSQKTKQKKESVHAQVIKQLNNSNQENLNREDYHFRLKMLEFNKIKTLETVTMGISVAQKAIKERLKNSSLNNKQKGEILLVATMEAYKVVDGLIKSIEERD